jgi:hypothetical protein
LAALAISVDEYEDSSTSDEESPSDAILRKAALKLQRAFRLRKFVTAIERSMMLSKKRKQVLDEIVSTERGYFDRLGQLLTNFVTPLSAVVSASELEMCDCLLFFSSPSRFADNLKVFSHVPNAVGCSQERLVGKARIGGTRIDGACSQGGGDLCRSHCRV